MAPRLRQRSVLGLARCVLAPVLLLQAAHVRRNALRLPEAAGQRFGAAVGRPGEPSVRVLFVGDSSAAGVGVAHQEQALAQQCAAALLRRTGRSVEWQLIARSGIDTAEASAMLEEHAPGPAEVIVTVLGVNDVTGQNSPRAFLASYQRLLGELQARTGARLGVVSGLPPMGRFSALPNPLRWYLGQCAEQLDEHLRAWVETQPRLRHLPLHWAGESGALATDGYHPGPEHYRQWADRVAQLVAELLSLSAA